jgi:acyl dehydratase
MVAVSMLYAEDLEAQLGSSIDLGAYTPTENEIIEFASLWDPQAFHVDPKVASSGHFGELIASGIHTLAIFQRLAVLGAYQHWAVIAGRRISAVEFTAPVTAGLTVQGSLVIDRIDHVKADRAFVSTRGSMIAGSVQIMTLVVDTYLRRRSNATGADSPSL